MKAKKTSLIALIGITLLLISLAPAFASSAGGSVILETSDDVSPVKTGPSVAFETSPLTDLISGYNVALQIPLTPRFTVGPKLTLFRYTGSNYSKDGSQIGVRAHYYLKHDWRETGLFLKWGFFRDNYSERGNYRLTRDGYAKGLMADLQLGIQVVGSQDFAFSASTGLESSTWYNDVGATGLFSKREGRSLTPVVELNISFAI